jgi:hypothetical protein
MVYFVIEIHVLKSKKKHKKINIHYQLRIFAFICMHVFNEL